VRRAGALSKENTRHGFGLPGIVDSVTTPFENSATTPLQNASPPGFPSETRTVHFPEEGPHLFVHLVEKQDLWNMAFSGGPELSNALRSPASRVA
jgi:hypothetical protein